MNQTIGFIGCGNMAKAMIGGMINSKLVPATQIIASDGYMPSLQKAKIEFGINITDNNLEVAKSSDIIILAIKPNIYDVIIEEIKDTIKEDVIIISITPGKSLAYLKEKFERDIKILRTMPNTPALVGVGVTAICPNENITKKDLIDLTNILSTFSLVEQIEEKLFDAFIAVSGSSPAYIFMIIEAMADGAVIQGMPRDKAYRFAAHAVLGSAKMVIDTGRHPADLKDMVCSPGGTTIEAVAKLEEKGLRTAIIEAMRVCAEKSAQM